MATSNDIEKVLKLLHNKLEDAQNDNLTLQARVEELKEQAKDQSRENDYLRNKIGNIQQDNANYSKTQTRLETQLYAQEQDTLDLRKQIQQLVKARRDMETKLDTELNAFEADRTAWQQREGDLYNQIRSMSLSEPRTPRTPRRPTSFLSTLDEHDSSSQHASSDHLTATPSSSSPMTLRPTPKLASVDAAREQKIAQRTIKAQDKMISDLRSELDNHQTQLRERERELDQQSLRIQHLDHEMASIKQVNQSLMEDNESYQILLHEKTLTGEFMMNPIMQVNSVLTEQQESNGSTLNLAAELNMANDVETSQKEAQDKQRLTEEVKTLQDTNRALQLYMNKILMKILDNKSLEDVLSIDQPKPTPDPPAPSLPVPPTPTPTKTFSSSLLGKPTARQQRRRTISYWGSKSNITPPSSLHGITPLPAKEEKDATDMRPMDAPSQAEIKARRHTVLPAPAAAAATTDATPRTAEGGWSKALRRMSFGWAATPVNEEPAKLDAIPPPVAYAAEMQLSQSGSSTTNSSLRASNELATLQEE
ncbi:hypothetical protein DM01DRAFT_1335916 [Hesseltinella vesiculosa]|uniref:Uncharacterized protein n=1 Tax=Hesseltinella vesiculosa TaxID=101127 RepID=A0A1X2GHS9_9FUNG|nr:hypothetical protein DM01DRAFT_1335916 [Hesseltinella vesiculosa]